MQMTYNLLAGKHNRTTAFSLTRSNFEFDYNNIENVYFTNVSLSVC